MVPEPHRRQSPENGTHSNLSSRRVLPVRANSGRRRSAGKEKSRDSTLVGVRAQQVFIHIFREIPELYVIYPREQVSQP